MNAHASSSILRCRSNVVSWIRGARTVAVIGAILAPATSAAHPQTRQGFFMGLGLARGSAAVSFGAPGSDREGGWGGGFHLGYAPDPKFALGIESSSCVEVAEGSAVTLGTLTAGVSVFPAEGLVLRGGLGVSDAAGAGDGVSGEVGTGWMVGAAYEFRVARSFALGPQIDYNRVSLSDADFNFVNVGFGMTWYFIPR